MSDLSATQCGCNNTREGNNGCCSLIWLIILLSVCGGNNDGCGCGGGFNLFNGGNDGCGCGCGSWIWILILLSCCGNSFC